MNKSYYYYYYYYYYYLYLNLNKKCVTFIKICDTECSYLVIVKTLAVNINVFPKNIFIFITEDGFWSEWSEFSSCSSECGHGTAQRIRHCIGPFNDGFPCDGDAFEEVECQNRPCAGN